VEKTSSAHLAEVGVLVKFKAGGDYLPSLFSNYLLLHAALSFVEEKGCR